MEKTQTFKEELKMTNNKPIHEIRAANVKASIWEYPDNQPGNIHKMSFTRFWHDDQQWRTSSSFRRDDLLALVDVAQRARIWILEQQMQAAAG